MIFYNLKNKAYNQYFNYLSNKNDSNRFNDNYINKNIENYKQTVNNNILSYDNKLIIKKIFFMLFMISLMIFVFTQNTSFAATPKIVTTLTNAFENIEDWFLKLATPAAAVAVGVGVFMKKFSFGDEERLRTAKRVIKGSLFSYGFLLALDLILQAIKSLI